MMKLYAVPTPNHLHSLVYSNEIIDKITTKL